MERLVNHIEMTIHPSQLRPILRALLFAIFFHRTLDAVEPETLELLESHIDQQNSNLSHQILIAPPSPADLFSPSSPPTHPMRLTSPPPAPFATPTTTTALDITSPIQVTTESNNSAKRALSPTRATLGYFEQAKDGLKAVSAKAGAGVGWGGRAMGAAFGRSANGY
nr:hypothetical protein L204_00959 [Cryptococcus depauperatus CBS 7855]